MRWWYWIDLIATTLSRLQGIFDAYMMGVVINEVQLFASHQITSLSKLYLYLSVGVFVRLLIQLFLYLHRKFDWFYSVHAMETAIEKAFIHKFLYLNWEHIENPEMEKKINRTLNRAADYIRRLAELHISFLATIITLTATIFIAHAPWWIILLSLIKEVPSIILTAMGARLQSQAEDNAQYDWIRKGTVFNYFRHFSTLQEIKTSRGQNLLLKIYDNLVISLRQLFLDKEKKLAIPWIVTFIYEALLNTSVYVFYLWQVLFKGMLLGTFQYTYTLINQIGSSIYALLTRVTYSVEYYRYVSYAYDLLELKNERPDGTRTLSSDKIIIEFKNVWFKYPGASHYSLKGVNLTVEDNARIAIVGENGAGKSTFLKLLNHIYVPTRGKILVNGKPIQEYKSNSYNSKIAVVTQDFARYDALTVTQNIAVFGKTHKINLQRVKRSAKLAEADKFISTLGQGYNTYLTKRLEGGTELSTGQWQRIAVARQFYANRPLVILDEPTSAIDPIAEAKIFENLYEHVKNKTVIVVSHRYNTVRAAKKILVFNDGQIIEQGSHKELIKLKGYYAKAFSVQQEKKKL